MGHDDKSVGREDWSKELNSRKSSYQGKEQSIG